MHYNSKRVLFKNAAEISKVVIIQTTKQFSSCLVSERERVLALEVGASVTQGRVVAFSDHTQAV